MADLLRNAEIRAFVGQAYRGIGLPTGTNAAGYTDEQLGQIPAGAAAWSLGVGNPVAYADLRAGDTVLDVGGGGGIDALLAARRVGSDGRVIGLDPLPEMRERARAHARQAGLGNVEFVVGEMEAIPLPDESVDAIVSNGVLNLSPRKMRALFECARVLRPGGRLCVSDMTLEERELPVEVLTHSAAWSGCVSGAMAERVLLASIGRVGLEDLVVHERHDFGIDGLARYPLFTPELLDVMRRTIPIERQGRVAVCVTISARRKADAGADGVIPSGSARNTRPQAAVPSGMSELSPTFDAGDRACGDGVGHDLRAWWAAAPAGTRTEVVVRDPSTKSDVPALARMLGHTVEREQDADGVLRLIVRTKRG